jgi:hypothetical protein
VTLCDPACCWWIYGEDPAMPQGHAGYWDDPRMSALVNEAAAGASRTHGRDTAEGVS